MRLLSALGLLMLAPFAVSASKKVAIDLAVMSRCPDAHICEAVMDDVLNMPNIKGKFHLKMNYIGTPTRHGVECKHGDIECAGNIQQLCVQHLTSHVWPFIQAQNYYDPEAIGEEAYAKKCAKAAGVEWSEIESCVNGDMGEHLLSKSVERTRRLGATKSCTIMVDHEVACIHDGEWYDCPGGHHPREIARTIEQAYNKKNSHRTSHGS